MKADQARVRDLVTQTITLMCRNGLEFCRDLRVEGLLAVTVDGSDVFVIHMDEKVTERPSYAAASCYTDTTTKQQQQEEQGYSASDDASGVDDVSVSHLNDDLFPSTLSAVDESESSAFSTEDQHSVLVKTEPNVDDSDDDAILMESDAKSLQSSNIPLPVIQGMTEYEDSGPPVRKKRTLPSSMSVGGIPTSVKNLIDDQLHNAHMWSGHPSYAPSRDAAPLPLSVESDMSYMAPHTGFPSAIKSQALTSGIILPMNTLSSRVVREALVKFLVEPLILNPQRCTVAFRITWRCSNSVDLDRAWLNIHQRRLICDDLVRRQPDVYFFFSCITGLYNKACSRTVASAFGVFPGISYYVVGDDNVQMTVVSSIRSSLFGGEFKLITARPTSTPTDMFTSPLYTVLKDYNCRYIKQQLIRSWQASNGSRAELEDAMLSVSLPIAKLIIVDCSMTEVVTSAFGELLFAAPSFSAQLEHPSS